MPVYNLEVEDCPEFVAGGILVHNCSFPGGENDDQADAFATGFNWLAERLLGGFEQGHHAARQAELGSRVDELFGRE